MLRRLGAHAAEATAAPDQAHVAVVLVVAHRPLMVVAAAPAAPVAAAAVVAPAGQDADAADAAVGVGRPPVGLRCAVSVGAVDVVVGHRLQHQQLQHHRMQHLDLDLDLGQDRFPNPGRHRQQWDPRRDCLRLYYRRRQQRRRRLRGGKRRFGWFGLDESK